MEILSTINLTREYSEISATHCIYLSLRKDISLNELEELIAFSKRNKLNKFYLSLSECTAVIVFNTEKEMTECFDKMEGITAVDVVAYSKGKFMYES